MLLNGLKWTTSIHNSYTTSTLTITFLTLPLNLAQYYCLMFQFLILFFGAVHHSLSQIEFRRKALAINLFLIVSLPFLRLWNKKTIENNHVFQSCQKITSANYTPTSEQ